MATCVLDASAILALLNRETGSQQVLEVLASGATCLVSAVNAAEVITKLLDHGATAEQAQEIWRSLGLEVVAFGAEQAWTAGALRAATRTHGLSLGDRACLALAHHRAPVRVLTADRAWQAIAGFDCQLIC